MLTKINLSPHFTLAEMLATQTFNGNGVDYNCESLTPEIYNNLVNTCKHLEVLRERLGRPVRINSGFRCKKVNDAVGGAPKSSHLDGCAADIPFGDFTTEEYDILLDFCRNYDSVKYYEIGLTSFYFHISFYPYA